MIPSLALNVISSVRDSANLQRLLESCQGPLFDERIVVIADTQFPNDLVNLLIRNYKCFVLRFDWIDDFSAARNYCLKNTKSDYVLWLDSDDVLFPEDYHKFEGLKKSDLDKYDFVLADYVYAHDKAGNPLLVLPRERIFKRNPKVQWVDPVHEFLVPQGNVARVKIAVNHYRNSDDDPSRNLRIYGKLLSSGAKLTPRQLFYYGKELYDRGQKEEGILVLNQYLDQCKNQDFADNHVVACLKLAQHYIDLKMPDKVIEYSKRATEASDRYAEPYYFLGMVSELSNIDTAIECYKMCLTKKLDAGFSQSPEYYGFLPAASLAIIYARKKNRELARHYCQVALSYRRQKDIVDLEKSLQDITPCWMVPGKIDLNNGSYRIRRHQIHERIPGSMILEDYFRKSLPELLEVLTKATHVVFMSFSLTDLCLMDICKNLNKKIIFDHCENIWDYTWQEACMQRADIITACSTALAKITMDKGYKRCGVIPDPFEPTTGTPDYNRENLKAGYFGMGGNSYLASTWLKPTLDELGYELVVCTEWDNATVKWDLNTWAEEMYKCDVILCPQRFDVQPAKSNCKLTQAMSMGLPVIGSPILAYKEIIRQGENGYIAETLDDWKNALIALKDKCKRKEIGEAAKESVSAYTPDFVSDLWIMIANQL